MYTSGTTGNPKGRDAQLRELRLVDRVGHEAHHHRREQTRMLSYLPLSHVAERMLVEHAWLAKGIHVFFAARSTRSPQDLQRGATGVLPRCRGCGSVPAGRARQDGAGEAAAPAQLPIIGSIVRKKVLKALAWTPARSPPAARAPMPPALLQWYARLGLDIVEVYGMTENCGCRTPRCRPAAAGHGRLSVRRRRVARPGDRRIQMRGRDA